MKIEDLVLMLLYISIQLVMASDPEHGDWPCQTAAKTHGG